MEKCCRLVAVSHNTSFNPVLMVTKYSHSLQACKWHLLSKNILGSKMDHKFKRGQPSKKTISRGILYSHNYFFLRKEKCAGKCWILGIIKDMQIQITKKPISSHQSERQTCCKQYMLKGLWKNAYPRCSLGRGKSHEWKHNGAVLKR